MKGVRVAPDGSIVGRSNVNVWEQDQLLPDAAFNGTDYVVVWSDRRHGMDQVYYTMVTADGRALDTAGIWLACQDTTMFQSNPAVASDGSGFLVAWLSGRSVGVVVQAARLSPDGVLLDSVPLDFTADTLFQNRVRIGSDGDDFLVTWCGEEPGGIGQDLYCCRVSPEGNRLDSVPVLVCRTTEGLIDPAVAFLRDRYLIAWCDQRGGFDVYAARVLADGTVLDPDGFPVAVGPEDQREPAVATDGKRFLVAWSEQRGSDFDIYADLVDTSGAVGLNSDEKPAPASPGLRLEASPNPCRGMLALRLPPAADRRPQELCIYNSSGQRVPGVRRLQTLLNEGVVALLIDCRGLASGVYLARLLMPEQTLTCRFTLLN